MYFPRMSGQVLRDSAFHGMSLCQAMWPLEMAGDPHLTGIGICYNGTNMMHNHIQEGVVTFFFHKPTPKIDAYDNIWYEQLKKRCTLVYTHAVNKISKRLLR